MLSAKKLDNNWIKTLSNLLRENFISDNCLNILKIFFCYAISKILDNNWIKTLSNLLRENFISENCLNILKKIFCYAISKILDKNCIKTLSHLLREFYFWQLLKYTKTETCSYSDTLLLHWHFTACWYQITTYSNIRYFCILHRGIPLWVFYDVYTTNSKFALKRHLPSCLHSLTHMSEIGYHLV